jgi:hypothetical protein
MSTDATKVHTDEAVLSYPNFEKPQQANGQGKPKFSGAFVFPGGRDSVKSLAAAAIAAARKKWGADADKMIKNGAVSIFGGKGAAIRTDAAAKKYSGDRFPEGTVFVNARSDQRPGLLFAHAAPGSTKPEMVPADKITDTFYPGCIVRASLTAFAYDVNGNKGVSFGLNAVQFLSVGERLDSKTSAEDEFSAVLSAAPADIDDLLK